MKHLILAAVVMGCATIKVTTPGRALVFDKTVEEVFNVVVQAVSASEFTIVSMNKDMGFISANRAGGFMAAGTGKDVLINCKITETSDGNISVDVTSTIGMAVAYGATKDAVKVLFQQLSVYLPDAKLTIDGKPFNVEE